MHRMEVPVVWLEIFLLVRNPWQIVLTTDHPNGGPFTQYPRIIHLLMDKSERDREILNLKMQGMTDQKIAEKVGFKNHSAVVKRRKQIAEHFQNYVENE